MGLVCGGRVFGAGRGVDNNACALFIPVSLDKLNGHRGGSLTDMMVKVKLSSVSIYDASVF